jgi:hypothetical protein
MIRLHIHSLETYLTRAGARLVRRALPRAAHGHSAGNLIVLCPSLSPEQELAALVHEAAHWLVHREAQAGALSTIYEYEAEAVEILVLTRLGLPAAAPLAAPVAMSLAASEDASPTDGLMPASLARVRAASARIGAALGLDDWPEAALRSAVLRPLRDSVP